MLLIYSSKLSSRIQYIFSLYFNEILGMELRYTDKEDEFKSYTGPKVGYNSFPVSDELFFYSRPLLFENDIRQQDINVFEWEGLKAFYPTIKTSALPFDPFAAGFFLISRYEEYLPHINDKYERFEAKESLAFQNGFLDKPVINIWASKIKELLSKKYPSLVFKQQRYEFISTIDIDNAYAMKEKGAMRNMGAFARSAMQLNFEEVVERAKVLSRLIPDPFDTYDYQLSIQKKLGFKSIYFFLLADYGHNDKNVPVNNRKFQALIKSISDYNEVGIHPGYGSNSDKKKLKKEQERLRNILNREVTKSRQHFLKLSFPETYRNLVELDITDDYTMGYASHYGFRAGICTSFYFYDLDLEIKTRLKVHPFAIMDGTLKDYMQVKPEDAMVHVRRIVDEVKAVNGTFISIWHNESLNDKSHWAGWRDVYEKMMVYALK